MRQVLASGIFAMGCSFALVALRGGDHVLAAVALMAACSTAAMLVRALGAAQIVDDVHDAANAARDGERVLNVGRVRDLS